MTPANDNRPAEFDAALVAYLPGLRGLAFKLRPNASPEYREDMVQATLLRALEKWRQYRPRNSPYTWLQFLMRSINRNAMRQERHAREIATRAAATLSRAELPSQEHAADLSKMLTTIRPDLRDDMLDVAAGSDMAQVAARRGISRERVRQVFNAERERWAADARRADTRRALAA